MPPTENAGQFLQAVLDVFNVRYSISESDRAHIPTQGPVVVVANHPFGALEGVIIASLLLSVRPDVRIVANYILERVPEIRHLFLSVDPFGRKDAKRRNFPVLKKAMDWLGQGGMLVTFPAGEVSHIHLRQRTITDPPWSTHVGHMARRTGAGVLPMYFHGANSPLFQVLGLLHPKARTALLPRELVNKANRTVRIDIGHIIPHERISMFSTDAELAEFLRLRTYLLKTREKHGRGRQRPLKKIAQARFQQRIAPASDPTILAREVARLPSEQCLQENGEFKVLLAEAGQIPTLLREIGRLREIAFRETGEGTGRALDIDSFDAYYSHLFVWSISRREVVGAYRLGQTDRILSRYGKKGFYTCSLFKYKNGFLDRIDPAIELGRSFVRPEYQKSYYPLLLLWKGIGQFVARRPHYRTLFGPVSISDDYHSSSRQLLVQFLRATKYLPERAKQVKPRRPFRGKAISKKTSGIAFNPHIVRDLDEVSELIASIEADEKGVPVLLRHYLKLGGKVVGFNRDDQFSDVLDVLVTVDLAETDHNVLTRYMGAKAATAFLALHAEQKDKHRAHRS